MHIETRIDEKRGCGWRKPGGLYLVAGSLALSCQKLPLPLSVCPVCAHGIKPARGWTWTRPAALLPSIPCGKWPNLPAPQYCPCPWTTAERAGLLWMGGQFYKTDQAFSDEAARLGISRRIGQIPRDFEVGKTWVLLAHRRVQALGGSPGIFQAFKPAAIEYVIKGDETEEELSRLVLRGITPVKIERKTNEASMTEKKLPTERRNHATESEDACSIADCLPILRRTGAPESLQG